MLAGIRGATSVENDNEKEIEEAVTELFQEILDKNSISISNIISVIFSVTPDLRSLNPATIVRKKFGLSSTPLMCLSEAVFKDSPKKIIRILIHCEFKENSKVEHVYLRQAINLRPDLSYKKKSKKGGTNP